MSYKVVAKSAIEIVAEFGPYDTLEDAKSDAQELADKMEEREDVDVYVLPPEAQAELGLEGPVAAFEGPELVIEEGGFSRAPLLNPLEYPALPYGHPRTPRIDFVARVYQIGPDGYTELFSAEPGTVYSGVARKIERLLDSYGVRFEDLEWTTSGSASKTSSWGGDPSTLHVELHRELGPFKSGPVEMSTAEWMAHRGRLDNPLRLSKMDKTAVRDFVDRGGRWYGKDIKYNKLAHDGRELHGLWMGGNGIAFWDKGEVYFRDLGSKAAETVQRFLKKSLPKNQFGGFRQTPSWWDDPYPRFNPERGPSASGANWNRLSWGWLYDNESDGVAFKVAEKPGPGIPLYTLTALTDNGVFKHKEPYQWKHPEGAFSAAKEWFPAMAGHTAFSDLTSNWLKLNPEQWLQEADQEIEDDGTQGAFTKQARRAGYKNTMEFARKVMAGWRSGKKTVLNKKTRKKQRITKKTMYRANFAINAQKRRRNPDIHDAERLVELEKVWGSFVPFPGLQFRDNATSAEVIEVLGPTVIYKYTVGPDAWGDTVKHYQADPNRWKANAKPLPDWVSQRRRNPQSQG